jgi:hypothetical protein
MFRRTVGGGLGDRDRGRDDARDGDSDHDRATVSAWAGWPTGDVAWQGGRPDRGVFHRGQRAANTDRRRPDQRLEHPEHPSDYRPSIPNTPSDWRP